MAVIRRQRFTGEVGQPVTVAGSGAGGDPLDTVDPTGVVYAADGYQGGTCLRLEDPDGSNGVAWTGLSLHDFACRVVIRRPSETTNGNIWWSAGPGASAIVSGAGISWAGLSLADVLPADQWVRVEATRRGDQGTLSVWLDPESTGSPDGTTTGTITTATVTQWWLEHRASTGPLDYGLWMLADTASFPRHRPAPVVRPPSGWRFHAQRWDGTWLHRELPLSDVQITHTLSGPGRLTATVEPVWGGLLAEDGRPLLEEWSTLIWAEVDGQIRGGGILVDSTFEGQRWRLDVAGISSYAADQPLVDTLTWGGPTAGASGYGVDPLDVVRALWAHLQGKPNGALGVVVDATTSPYRLGAWHNARRLKADGTLDDDPKAIQDPPIPIDKVWDPKRDKKPAAARGKTVYWKHELPWWGNTIVGSHIDDLARRTPFDYREHLSWADSDRTSVVKRLELGYPRLGKRQTSLRFVEDENITSLVAVKRSGDDYANEVRAYGAGEGSKQLRETRSVSDGRLRRAHVLDAPEIMDKAALAEAAAGDLRWRQNLTDITGFTVIQHPHARLGSFAPGDDVLVETRGGWWPTRLWVRITSLTISPYSQTVQVTCRRSDSFDYSGR